TGDLDLIHGGEIDGTDTEHQSADAEGEGHAYHHPHLLMGQEVEDEQHHGCDHKDDAQVFDGGVGDLVGHKPADGPAQHLQAVLVDDAVSTYQGHGQRIGFLQKGDEVGQPAVHTVDHEDVHGDKPDVAVFQGADHAVPCGLIFALVLTACL